MIQGILQGMTAIRATLGLPLRELCALLDVPYSTVRRWHGREQRGEPILHSPGPRKIVPLRMEELSHELQALRHKRHVSYGTQALYQRYACSISRRELQSLIRTARQEITRRDRQALRRIEWHVPNLVWAMDDLECTIRDTDEQKLYAHRLQDLASRYKFHPLTGEFPCGEEIAGHLAAQCARYGAPLLLKRDHGGNLNHPSVNAVLEDYSVLPLPSPPYYAPYNGAMEESQGEFHRGLQEKLSPHTTCPKAYLQASADAVENELNHRPRPCLGGRSSCQVYFEGKDTLRFSKKQRRQIYDWTMSLTGDILYGIGGNASLTWQSAWRIAVETWLRHKGYITVARDGKVSPNCAG